MMDAKIANTGRSKRKKTALTYENVSELLFYNAESGTIHWKKDRPPSAKAGDTAGAMGKHYFYVGILGNNVAVHKIVWLLNKRQMPIGHIDHINRIKTDNRVENLQEVSRSENAHNNTKAKGWTFNKSLGLYVAQIHHNKKHYHLGSYKTAEEAGEAYLAAKRALRCNLAAFGGGSKEDFRVIPARNGLYRTNTSGQKNVSFKRGAYEVTIKGAYVGRFKTIKEAVEARDRHTDLGKQDKMCEGCKWKQQG